MLVWLSFEYMDIFFFSFCCCFQYDSCEAFPMPTRRVRRSLSSAQVAPASAHRGLMNLGNTCFANAMIQSLACCAPIASHLMHDVPEVQKARQPVTQQLRALISLLVSDDSTLPPALNATDFLRVLRHLKPSFSPGSQQDSMEVR